MKYTKILQVFLPVMLLPMVIGCDSTKKQLKIEVDKIARQTPLVFGASGDLGEIQYNPDENVVTVDWMVNEAFVNVSALAAAEAKQLDFFRVTFLNNRLMPVLDNVVAANAVLKVKYIGNTKLEMTLDAARIKEIMDMPLLTSDEINKMLVDDMCENIKANSEVRYTDGMRLCQASTDGEWLILTYQLDGSTKALSQYRSISNLNDIVKYQIKQELKSSAWMHTLLPMLADMKYGLKIRYCGNSTSDFVQGEIPANTVRNIASLK